MLLRKGNAVLLARLALGGSLVVAASAPLSLLHLPAVPAHPCGFWSAVWAYRARIFTLFSPLVVGFGLGFWAERTFKRGVLEDLWTEEELVRVRRLIESKVWMILAGSAFLFWCVLLFGFHTIREGGLAYVLVLPSQMAQRFSKLITPKVPRGPGLRDWRSFQPIRSEHWGEDRARS